MDEEGNIAIGRDEPDSHGAIIGGSVRSNLRAETGWRICCEPGAFIAFPVIRRRMQCGEYQQ
jgi:hypothetical protein